MRVRVLAGIALLLATVNVTSGITASAGAALARARRTGATGATGPTSRVAAGGSGAATGGGGAAPGAASGGTPDLSQIQGAADAVTAAIGQSTAQTKELLNSLMSSVKNDPGQLITKDMLQNLVRDHAFQPQKAGTHSVSMQSDQGFNGLSNYQPSGWVMTETVSGPAEKIPQMADEKVPVYSYPKGVGPVLINSCTDSKYTKGSPCFASKQPGEGKVICPNILDGASYIGVGFDGRGFYKIESRRGSLVQRACANLATFIGQDVPDTMNVFGIYETMAETKSFQSADEYLSYIRDKAGLSEQKNLFLSEASKHGKSSGFGFNLGAIGAIVGGAIGGPIGASLGGSIGGAIGGGTASGSGSSSSKEEGKSNSQFSQNDQSKTQQGASNNFFAVMYVNIIMYEITLDEVKPQDINLAVLKDYMSLPVSYYSVGADVKYQNFLLRWGTHYIRSGKFGGQLKITKTAKSDKVSSAQEFASIAETEFQSMFSSLQSKYSQESSSWNFLGFGGESNSASQNDKAHSENKYQSTMNQQSKLSQNFRQSEFTQTIVEAQGGTPEIAEALVDFYTPAFKQLYHKWIVSIKDYVKPFEFQLTAIDQLFNLNMDDLFPAGNLDFGCMGTTGTTVKILFEPETNRRYYLDERTSFKKNETTTKTVKTYCKYSTLEDFKTDLDRRRISLEKAVAVYMVEGPFPTSTFELEAGQPGCEQTTLAQINLFSKGSQTLTFTELSKSPFLISFDLPQDIPNILKSQAKYIMVYRADRWFATESAQQLIHLYDGCQLTGYKPEATKICFVNIILTYEEKTGFFHIDPLDFEASKRRKPMLPDWLSGSTVARASKLDISGGVAAIQGSVPCNVKWLNSHRLDPSKNTNCIHFTAASAGDIFVAFASIPRDHSTWYYLQINMDGVAFFKAMQLQKRDYQRGMGSLGDKNLYQSFFVCVNQANGTVLMQYGKSDPDSDVGTVYSGYKFAKDSQYSRLSFYSFGAGSKAVSLMDIRLTKQMPKVTCLNTNYILHDGHCILDCHNECIDCNLAKDDHACFHCRNVRVETSKTTGETNTKVVQCLPECPRGYELSDKNEKLCVPCTAGNFKSSTGNQKCVPCAAGSFSSAVGAFECTSCSPGTFSASAGAIECQKCKAGTSAKLVGSTSCSTCEPGSFASIGQAECSPCLTGHFSATAGQSHCQMCAVGFFAGTRGMTHCSPCPAGTSSVEGAMSCENNCKKGEFSPFKGVPCNKCPSGTFGPSAGSTSCISCPAGSFQDKEGQESCSTAPAGSYASGPGASSKILCPAGTANPATGKSSASDCVPCSAGSYSSVAGSEKCDKCPLGHYQPLSNQKDCLKVSAGNYVDAIGQAEQKPCPPGKFSASGASSCILCSAGSFADKFRSTNCNQCPGGSWSGTGAVVCIDCAAGFHSKPGAASCLQCSAGSFAAKVKSTDCHQCPAGSWSGAGSAVCKDCAAGFYSNAGAASCLQCSAGSFADKIKSTGCQRCPAGSWSGAGSSVCSDCAAGYYSNAGAASCLQCSEGSFSDRTRSTGCHQCPAGSWSRAGAASCMNCAAGFYSNRGAGGCLSCPAGHFSNQARASECMSCPHGKFADATGSSFCKDCPAGKYNNKAGSRDCAECPGGTFSNHAAATGCHHCDSNFALARRTGLNHCDFCPHNGATTNDRMGCLHSRSPHFCIGWATCHHAYDNNMGSYAEVPSAFGFRFLISAFNLRKIFIYRRQDCCPDRSRNLEFTINDRHKCYSDDHHFDTYRVLDCHHNHVEVISAKQMRHHSYLSVAEFRFYGE